MVRHILFLNDLEYDAVYKALQNEIKRQNFRYKVGCGLGFMAAIVVSQLIIGKIEEKILNDE